MTRSGSKSYSVDSLAVKDAKSGENIPRNTREYCGLFRRRIINIKKSFTDRGGDRHP